MCHVCRSLLVLLLWLLVTPAMAGTGYKCVDAHGHVSYQDTPCPRGSQQSVLQLANAIVVAPASVSTAPPPALPSAAPMSPPPLPAAPLPVLYRCSRATGGTYLSRSGRTRPYFVPYSMLGMAPVPLSAERGTPTPRPSPTPAMLGSHYVQVRDSCRQLPPDVACAALEKRNDTNDQAIHDAFPDARAPLLKKRKRLHAQLAGCPD